MTNWLLLQKCNDVINAKSICRLGWQPGSGKVSDRLFQPHLNPSFLFGSTVEFNPGKCKFQLQGLRKMFGLKFTFRKNKPGNGYFKYQAVFASSPAVSPKLC